MALVELVAVLGAFGIPLYAIKVRYEERRRRLELEAKNRGGGDEEDVKRITDENRWRVFECSEFTPMTPPPPGRQCTIPETSPSKGSYRMTARHSSASRSRGTGALLTPPSARSCCARRRAREYLGRMVVVLLG